MNPYNKHQWHIKNLKNLIGLRSWRSKLAVATKEGVILLDVKDESFHYRLSSESVIT